MKELCDIPIDAEAARESIRKFHIDREGFERKHPTIPTGHVSVSSNAFPVMLAAMQQIVQGTRWDKKARIVLEYDPQAEKMEIDVFMESPESDCEKPTQEAGAVYEVTKAEIEKALNDAEARHSGPAYGEKTTGSDVADQNRLEKSYTCILPHGGCIKIDISATAESIGKDTFPALAEIGIATRDFYLEFGREINGKTTEQGVPE